MSNIREPTDFTNFPWWDDRNNCIPKEPIRKDPLEINRIFSTPKSIYDYFDKHLFGCEKYKRTIATAIWSSLKKNIKSNFIVIGESGCGKTSLAHIVQEIYENTTIFDASSISPKGYKGNATFSDALLSIDTSPNALPAWIFIDEFDKVLAKNELGVMLEAEILKCIEGAQIFVGDEKSRQLVDTSRVNFVFLGTFAHLKKERKHNIGFSSVYSPNETTFDKSLLTESKMLSNEFLGRINEIITLEPMTNEKALQLLSQPHISPISKLSKQYGINLQVSPEKYEELANMTTRYGIRGIYSELTARINDALFEDSSIKELTI